jgi:DtxR family Mn-dependent transcriptional regulator
LKSLTVENYLKAIYSISTRTPSGDASTGELARRLRLTPGTVTSMVQRLAEAGLADYKVHHGVRLTEEGVSAALRVIRRHRLIELFLWKTLGLPWDAVHDEAEHLEHAASDRLIDRIDEYLGYPDRDPHGDPIPDSDGRLPPEQGKSLAACASQTEFELLRVPDDSPDFLRYLSQGGLNVGTKATVLENNPSVGILVIKVGQSQISLGRETAGRLIVKPV